MDLLTEGVNDKGVLKAVFMAGGPGSGKSYVARELFGIPKKINVSVAGLKTVNSDSEFEFLLKKYGFETVGGGLDINLWPKEVFDAIKNIKEGANYNGGTILQEFLEPVENNDYRVWIIGGKLTFHHKRSLIAVKDNEKPWLASRSLGSKILLGEEKLPIEIEELAIKSTKAIKADLNVLDIIKTKKGYAVIENNPTPNLRPEYVEVIGFNPVEFLYKQIIKICPLQEIELTIK